MRWSNIIHDLFSYEVASPMLFNSGQFLFFFVLFLIAYAFLFNNKLSRTLFVLGFSFFFYYKASGWYLIVLLVTLGADYALALAIQKAKQQKYRVFWLVVSLCTSLGLLAYFKYTNFFAENCAFLCGYAFDPYDIFLPIGISFYTFQTLSYIIDVYKRELEPTHNFLDYAFYMCFFPHLVAGPIVRAKFFLPQLKNKIIMNPAEIQRGFFLIMQGLFKKAVLADYVAQYNDLIFAAPGTYSGFENLMAMYGYTLQIYCDFSGYSDMAIGIGLLMGFDLGINFNKPYQALSLTDFWRRWHISLSAWLRDYLYISLGGNRKGKVRQYVNLFITMLLGGLWHGPSWKFVFWGGMHGLGLAVHKAWKKYVMPGEIESKWGSKVYNFFAWFITFHFVVFLWVFFRADDFGTAWTMITQITSGIDMAYLEPFWKVRYLFVILMLVGFAIHAIPSRLYPQMEALYVKKVPFVLKAIAFVLLIQLCLQFKSESVQPFIYFQF